MALSVASAYRTAYRTAYAEAKATTARGGGWLTESPSKTPGLVPGTCKMDEKENRPANKSSFAAKPPVLRHHKRGDLQN
eukprot:CAMPEP_0206433154 /NCGR_PEP_ID=MMETSP0324_2-20121206/8365_1 /ASSEMBLY_ACC=CAM_ASM_000836 /TAXON_ID=2866 /ORGANISM="Crypthecodinium cohnii, Strain Seligo" /LENGTH=78 /DNA_ID=CAMNT_0053899367 /DNA_START=157 /DNA_END=391 /DNA_ORIENTATION=-